MPSISLYAESLLNLRQVTVFATLQSNRNVETLIKLSSDRKTLGLTHGGKQASIELPSDIDPDAKIAIPSSASDHFCLRLPVVSIVKGCDQFEPFTPNEAPWFAGSLKAAAQFCCRSCKNHVMGEQINEWRDLPSENWAEMMDFWHCHKPKNGAGSDTLFTSKGCTASEGLQVREGLGLVDSCHMVVSQEDCYGLKVCSCIPPRILVRISGQQEGGLFPHYGLGCSMVWSPIQMSEIDSWYWYHQASLPSMSYRT